MSRDHLVRLVVDVGVVGACSAFVFWQMQPSLVLSAPIPTGGDMGAHVWGPAHLRDHLLPAMRLSGWSPDWFAGFPAYQFYMVVPSLLVVALDLGLLAGWAAVAPVLVAAALAAAALTTASRLARRAAALAGVVVALAGVDLPYGVAFKLVAVAGLVTLPVAAYAFGRLADLSFPAPAVLAVATLPFLFNRNFTIFGGNVFSTLAGEFAFSISLSIGLVYLGVVARGLRTGAHRALGALLLALTGLCHLIPAFFVLGATAVIALFNWRRQTLWWLAAVLPVGGLLSAFWVLPFWWQRDFVNDMGWEKLPRPQDGRTIWDYLLPTSAHFPDDMRWVAVLAALGLALSLARRLRIGPALAVSALGTAVAFVVLPEGRLWNARLLPFHYLSLYLLAGIGFEQAGRSFARLAAAHPNRPSLAGRAVTALAALAAGLVVVGLPLGALPFGQHRPDGSFHWLGLRAPELSAAPAWARWNFSGYEGKEAYPEFRDLMLTMGEVGEERGCGRALWEYDKELLNRYGTPMAPMLLPYYTGGCIGSMEGLFFESSATTPFHFLMQSHLSAAPSMAQRRLPYRGLDVQLGVMQLQLMGVRYYLTNSVAATAGARAHPDLSEIATSGPWVIFEVAGAELVEPLAAEPVVLEGVDHGQGDWLCRALDDQGRCDGPALAWFMDPDRWVAPLAASGPPDWERVDPDRPVSAPEWIEPAVVRRVEVGRDRIRFEVDEAGSPVLVKVSYFPNWEATGAHGPFRVAPNLMVVVPTAERVELSFGREAVDWAALALSAAGLAALAALARRRPARAARHRPWARRAGQLR